MDCYYPGEEEEIKEDVCLTKDGNPGDHFTKVEDTVFATPDALECDWGSGYESSDYFSTSLGCKLYFRSEVHYSQDDDLSPTPLGVPYVDHYDYRCKMGDLIGHSIFIDSEVGFDNLGIHNFDEGIELLGDKIVYINDDDSTFQSIYAQDGDTYIYCSFVYHDSCTISLSSVKWSEWDRTYYTSLSDNKEYCQIDETKELFDKYNIKYEGLY